MDKFLKRKKDDVDDDARKVSKSDATTVPSSSKITLVVLPGIVIYCHYHYHLILSSYHL